MNHPARFRAVPRLVARVARRALPLAVAVLLAGCLSLGDSPELTVYAPQVRVEGADALPRIDVTLSIGEPNASTMLDSNRIAVRPQPSTLQVYGGAVWADNAPSLLQSALVDAFGESERFRAVIRPTDSVGADLQLRLDLRHFEAAYAEGTKAPSAVIDVHATLIDQRTHRVAASRRFRAEHPADREKLEQVVPAFEVALSEIATAMLPWVIEHSDASPAR